MLDYDAGRAEWFTSHASDLPKHLRLLQGKVRSVVGPDLETAVLSKRTLDEPIVVKPHGSLPLNADSVGLVVADHVFEHIEETTLFARVIASVLKSGGWVDARTTNRPGYIAISASNGTRSFLRTKTGALHNTREELTVLPMTFKMNTRSHLRYVFPLKPQAHAVYALNPELAYVSHSRNDMADNDHICAFLPGRFGGDASRVRTRIGDSTEIRCDTRQHGEQQ